jgi:SAM-dependent methyltransferase
MSSAKSHYADQLGRVYSWSVGGIDAAISRGESELQALTANPQATGAAVDLGAGFGMHAIPLAMRGFRVLAIDSCAVLLDELQDRQGGLAITCIQDDLLNCQRHIGDAPELVLCMGDTLTHLDSVRAVEQLVGSTASSLCPGGRFVASFRDYTQGVHATARFIPVRSDESRIMTCFLEYGEDTVTVHDLLYERDDPSAQAAWRFSVSAYPKLRLSPERVLAMLQVNGLAVTREPGPSGMVRLVGVKPLVS